MGNARRGPIPDELGWLMDMLEDHSERLRTLEAPSGEQLANSVATLRSLVENIQAQLADFIANDIGALVTAAVTSALTGNIAIGGSLTVAGAVTTPGSLTVGGTVTMPGARATDLSAAPNRVNAWLAGDGRLGRT
ncbi:hypothetical protein [Microbacterium sp. CGR1]|uniref:hypothetical protein n=1 Tax=Microbacterium sp. CGR1 TaxID=1696072 RepID=UPI003DA5BA59